MNPPKSNAENHIQWLIASAKVVSSTETACTDRPPVAHDASPPSLRPDGRKSRIGASLTLAT